MHTFIYRRFNMLNNILKKLGFKFLHQLIYGKKLFLLKLLVHVIILYENNVM